MKRIVLLILILMLACSCPAITVDFGDPAPVEPQTVPVEPPTEPVPPVVAAPETVITGEGAAIARRHLQALTDIGPRWAGTPEDVEAQQYIAGAFDSIGYVSEIQPFTAYDEWEEEYVDSANVVAVKAGQSTLEIIVGAHYDSSDEGLGTDDNASGVAVLLAAAELVREVDTPYTIIFVAFGGEEAGFLGSTAYVEQMDSSEIANVVVMINLDCVSVGDIAYVYSDEGPDAAARDWILAWAGANGYPLQTIPNVDLQDDGYGVSDYDPFSSAGIPWAYFEATNWTLGDQDGYTQVDERYADDGMILHTQYDDLAYFDATFPGRVDQRLDLFVTVLVNFLTQYQAPR